MCKQDQKVWIGGHEEIPKIQNDNEKGQKNIVILVISLKYISIYIFLNIYSLYIIVASEASDQYEMPFNSSSPYP